LDIQVDYEIARSHYLSALFLLPGMGPDQFPPAEAFQSRFAPPRDRGGPDAGRDGFGPPRIPIGDPSPRKPPPRKQREVRGRQQPPISRVKSLAEAIDRANLLLERLETQGTDTQPSIDQFATQRLLASALLERSRLGSRPDRNGDGEASESMRTDKQQSIQIFRRLVADHPSYDSLKYELATALADMDVFAADTKSPSRFASSDPSSTDADSEQAEDLREAMAIFDDLNARQPEVPRYALSNLHTRFKLARMLHVPHGVQDSPRGFPGHPGPPPRRNFARPENDRPPENRGDGPPGRSRMIESLNLYQSCVQLQNRLMDQNPDAEAYPVWQALFLEHVGEIQMQMHLDGEALQTYLKLDDIWRQIEEQQTYQPDLTNRQRQRASEQLDSLLERATRN
jgi:tetratricopeptide (TPR) repeat protein